MPSNTFVLKLTQQQADNLANMLDLACKAGGLQVLDAVHDLTQVLKAAVAANQQSTTKAKKATSTELVEG